MKRVILWFGLLAAGFLMGFVPQYLTARRLEAALSGMRRDMALCQFSGKLSHLRDSAALIYLETTRKNYGLAGEHASRFFDHVRDVAGQTEDPALRRSLEEILSLRDNITAALAKADAAVLSDLQRLLLKIHQSTTR